MGAWRRPQNTNPDVGRVQQQISEGRVVFGGKDVVLGVNNVEAQRAELLHLHRLASVLPGLQEVPAESQFPHPRFKKKKKKQQAKTVPRIARRCLQAGGFALRYLFVACKHKHGGCATCAASDGRLEADVCLNN